MKNLVKSLGYGIFKMVKFTLGIEVFAFIVVLINMLVFLHSLKYLSLKYFLTFGFTDPFIFFVLFLGIIIGLTHYFKNYAVGGKH